MEFCLKLYFLLGVVCFYVKNVNNCPFPRFIAFLCPNFKQKNPCFVWIKLLCNFISKNIAIWPQSMNVFVSEYHEAISESTNYSFWSNGGIFLDHSTSQGTVFPDLRRGCANRRFAHRYVAYSLDLWNLRKLNAASLE